MATRSTRSRGQHAKAGGRRALLERIAENLDVDTDVLLTDVLGESGTAQDRKILTDPNASDRLVETTARALLQRHDAQHAGQQATHAAARQHDVDEALRSFESALRKPAAALTALRREPGFRTAYAAGSATRIFDQIEALAQQFGVPGRWRNGKWTS